MLVLLNAMDLTDPEVGLSLNESMWVWLDKSKTLIMLVEAA